MDQINIPNHLAIIVDGNRRWEKEHNMPAFMGHKHGFERLEKVIGYAVKLGIPYISLFVFSTENFKRDVKEVDYPIPLYRFAAGRFSGTYKRRNPYQQFHAVAACLFRNVFYRRSFS